MSKLISTTSIGTESDYLSDEIENTKVLIEELNKKIQWCIQNGRQSYSIDTGQTKQSISVLSFSAMITQRKILLAQLDELENAACVTSAGIVVRPWNSY